MATVAWGTGRAVNVPVSSPQPPQPAANRLLCHNLHSSSIVRRSGASAGTWANARQEKGCPEAAPRREAGGRHTMPIARGHEATSASSLPSTARLMSHELVMVFYRR